MKCKMFYKQRLSDEMLNLIVCVFFSFLIKGAWVKHSRIWFWGPSDFVFDVLNMLLLCFTEKRFWFKRILVKEEVCMMWGKCLVSSRIFNIILFSLPVSSQSYLWTSSYLTNQLCTHQNVKYLALRIFSLCSLVSFIFRLLSADVAFALLGHHWVTSHEFWACHP